jgi:hypothetical protein
VRYDDIADLLPQLADGPEGVGPEVVAFVDSDLRSQAELARYRRLIRSLQLLRNRPVDPAPGLLAQTLATLESADRRVRIVTRRRIAYAGALAGVAAGAAATAVVLVRRRMSLAGSVG